MSQLLAGPRAKLNDALGRRAGDIGLAQIRRSRKFGSCVHVEVLPSERSSDVVSCDDHRDQDALPRVVVLLAAYNGMNFLAPQVNSILQQQGVSVTLYISADESTDGTRAWAAALSKADPRVHLMVESGRFGSASANFFRLMCDVEVGEFDFVALSDQDDIWLPAKLSRAVESMRTQGSVGYSASVWAFYEDGSRKVLKKAGRQRRWDFLFSSPGPGCTHVLRTDVFAGLQQTLRSHRPALAAIEYHDWVDYAYVRQRDLAWYIDPNPQMLYRQHNSNQLGANVGMSAKLRRASALRGGWMWWQARLICELVGAEETMPYKLLVRGGIRSRLTLAGMSPSFRRSPRDAAALALSFLLARRKTV